MFYATIFLMAIVVLMQIFCLSKGSTLLTMFYRAIFLKVSIGLATAFFSMAIFKMVNSINATADTFYAASYSV